MMEQKIAIKLAQSYPPIPPNHQQTTAILRRVRCAIDQNHRTKGQIGVQLLVTRSCFALPAF